MGGGGGERDIIRGDAPSLDIKTEKPWQLQKEKD